MAVPNFPQTLPANTVVGRLSAGSGQAETITFSELAAALARVAISIAAAVPAKGATYPTTIPQYPAEISASTVIGRLASTDGESQAISFCTFNVALYPYIVRAIVN